MDYTSPHTGDPYKRSATVEKTIYQQIVRAYQDCLVFALSLRLSVMLDRIILPCRMLAHARTGEHTIVRALKVNV